MCVCVFECVGVCARVRAFVRVWVFVGERDQTVFILGAWEGGRGSDMEMSWRRGLGWIGRRRRRGRGVSV